MSRGRKKIIKGCCAPCCNITYNRWKYYIRPRAHNPEVEGSSPFPATKKITVETPVIARDSAVFCFAFFSINSEPKTSF